LACSPEIPANLAAAVNFLNSGARSDGVKPLVAAANVKTF